MTPYVPLLQGLITATGVITAAVVAAILARRSYVKQKEIDRQEDLRQRRAGEYESYIKASRKIVRHAERLHEQGGENADTEWFLGESRAEYDEAYNYLVVIASDDVFLCATALHDRLSEYFDRASIDTEEMRANGEIRDLYIDLITAIRRDCFEETKLSKEQINPLLNWLP
jgi:sensor c-di-GMP phosphodiesterase-like protein